MSDWGAARPLSVEVLRNSSPTQGSPVKKKKWTSDAMDTRFSRTSGQGNPLRGPEYTGFTTTPAWFTPVRCISFGQAQRHQPASIAMQLAPCRPLKIYSVLFELMQRIPSAARPVTDRHFEPSLAGLTTPIAYVPLLLPRVTLLSTRSLFFACICHPQTNENQNLPSPAGKIKPCLGRRRVSGGQFSRAVSCARAAAPGMRPCPNFSVIAFVYQPDWLSSLILSLKMPACFSLLVFRWQLLVSSSRN